MLGANPGWVTSQHEILAQRFAESGADVCTTSSIPSRLPRLADTLWTVGRWRRRVDVLVIAVFSGPGFWLADATSRLAKWLGIPQVLVLHGGDLPDYRRLHPLRVDACLGRADAVVAPSPYLASRVPSQHRIEVIPNTFDLGTIPFRKRRLLQPRLLWMRTFHLIYNPLLAIEALALLHETHPEASLTMAGQEKGMLGDCVRRTHELGLDGSVDFPGYLDEERKRDAFAAHDLFLNTNDVDNTPVSVLEAAGAGLPVVATAVGGLPFLLEDQRSALLVPPGDPAAMAEAVRRLLDDDDLAESLSLNGHRRATESDWTSVGPKWSATLEAVRTNQRSSGIATGPDAEQARIEAVYRDYRESGRDLDRWDDAAPGNRVNLEARRQTLKSLLRTRRDSHRVLEVGCGSGGVMAELGDLLGPQVAITGVDLLMDRLLTASERGHVVLRADGRALPFRDKSFDLVAVFTVFSSILDPQVQAALSAEIVRVLSDTGAVLWYDLRLPSPNRSVRPLSKSDVGRLFPTLHGDLTATTLLPPLARRLGSLDGHLVPLLTRVPPLRSHLMGLLER